MLRNVVILYYLLFTFYGNGYKTHQGLYLKGRFRTVTELDRISGLMRAGEMAQVVNNTSSSCRGSKFDSQHPLEG